MSFNLPGKVFVFVFASIIINLPPPTKKRSEEGKIF